MQDLFSKKVVQVDTIVKIDVLFPEDFRGFDKLFYATVCELKFDCMLLLKNSSSFTFQEKKKHEFTLLFPTISNSIILFHI